MLNIFLGKLVIFLENLNLFDRLTDYLVSTMILFIVLKSERIGKEGIISSVLLQRNFVSNAAGYGL